MQRYEIISTYILHYSAKNPSRGKFIYITREFELDHEGNSSTSRCNFKFIIICKSRCIFQHYDGILSTRSWYIVNLFAVYHRAVDTLLSFFEYISFHFSSAIIAFRNSAGYGSKVPYFWPKTPMVLTPKYGTFGVETANCVICWFRLLHLLLTTDLSWAINNYRLFVIYIHCL